MKYIIFFSTISILFIACIKEECKVNGGFYEFEIPATLSPAKDTFKIGDTIRIISSFNSEVYERKTDKSYHLENFRFFPRTLIRKIDTVEASNDGLKYFYAIIGSEYDYDMYQYSSGTQQLIGQYKYENNKYNLEFELVPREAGLFILTQGVSPDLASGQDFEGKCSNLENDGAVVLNDGADNNIHLLSDSPDPHYNDWILQKPEDRFHKFGGYCFYVRE